jgi:hypothetical protein
MPRRSEDGAWCRATEVACQQEGDRSQTFGRGLAAGRLMDGRCFITRTFALRLGDDAYALEHLRPRFDDLP